MLVNLETPLHMHIIYSISRMTSDKISHEIIHNLKIGIYRKIANWIIEVLHKRKIRTTASAQFKSVSFRTTKGYPLSSFLSPHLWSLVVDELFYRLDTNVLESSLMLIRNMIGRTWRINPQMDTHFAISRPIIMYASSVWWERTLQVIAQKKLEKIQRSKLEQTIITTAMEVLETL